MLLDWLAEQDVPLIRVRWTGEAITVAGGSGYSALREKVEWQRATRSDPERRIEFGIDLIARKIEASVETLRSAIPHDPARDHAIALAKKAIEQLHAAPPKSAPELLGIEGPTAAAYFRAWEGVPLQWHAPKRRPIPDAWRTLGPRASLRADRKSKNKSATHPINAMLNYGYAVALGQTKIQALKDGYDPTIGIMHREFGGAPAFALDLFEPVRPVVDRAVLDFALGQELHPADFVIAADGSCRLNPQMAGRVVQLCHTDSVAPVAI